MHCKRCKMDWLESSAQLTNKKIEIRYRTTSKIYWRRLRIINTTKIRPLQGNGMAAISKKLLKSLLVSLESISVKLHFFGIVGYRSEHRNESAEIVSLSIFKIIINISTIFIFTTIAVSRSCQRWGEEITCSVTNLNGTLPRDIHLIRLTSLN